MIEPVGLLLVALGVAFNLFGCIGLIRLPDVYNRLQAATKCVTGGTCLILIGSVISLGTASAIVKGALCVVFIAMTAPAAAHALARAAHRSGVALSADSVVDRYAEASRENGDRRS